MIGLVSASIILLLVFWHLICQLFQAQLQISLLGISSNLIALLTVMRTK